MTFTSKNIQSRKNSMGFLKGATLFFLGLSGVLFVTTAFNIAPIAPNAIQYIKTIFLTASGNNTSATGIILEGLGGDGRFKNSVTVNSLSSVPVIGTNASGKLIQSTAQGIYNYISGFISNGGTSTGYRTLSGTNIYKTNIGNVGIGIATPMQPLQVIGNILGGDISNSIIGTLSSILGGIGNVINGSGSVIVGGGENTIANQSGGISSNGDASFIGAGFSSHITGYISFIGGGSNNNIFGDRTSIVGGKNNTIICSDSIDPIKCGGFIGGGEDNTLYYSGNTDIPNSSIIGGSGNTINGILGFIGGGKINSISDLGSVEIDLSGTTITGFNSIVGGFNNLLTGMGGFIGGGATNSIYGMGANIVGGNTNTINGEVSNIVGGEKNKIGVMGELSIKFSSIVGGSTNYIYSHYGFIGGGEMNIIQGQDKSYASIVGGYNNITNNGTFSFIGGGKNNSISGQKLIEASNILGGLSNTIYDSNYSFIGGGSGNKIKGTDSSKDYSNSIIGGSTNFITREKSYVKNSTIGGGYGNKIADENGIDSSFVAGYMAIAATTNTFVRNSDTNTEFKSNRPNTFLINAPFSESKGGVGINIANPKAALDVSGNIATNSFVNAALHYSVGGTPGKTANVSVQNGPTGDPCTLNFKGGILVGTNCAIIP